MTRLAVAQVVRVGVFAILAWMLVGAPQDLPAVGWAEVAATTAMTAYCIYVQHTAIVPLRLAGSLRGMAALANESAPVAMSNVIWTITQYAPLFLIASRVGGEQTGWFAGATRVVVSLLIFSSLYHFNLDPAVSRALSPRDGNPGALLARSFRVAAWSGIFAALALTLLAEPLMVLAMGANMRPATPMLQIMAWVLPVVLCSGHARAALVAVGARARMLVAQLAGLVATVLFGLLLGRVAGGVGYAAAAVAGAIVVWIFAQVLAARRGCSPPPFKLAVRPALLAAAVLVGAQALSAGIWQSLAGLLLFAAAAPLVDRRLIQDFLKLGAAGADAAD